MNVIAIDGPAGSGKSTVAKSVAKALGFLYIDTGAMYRALTLKAIMAKIDLKNEPRLIKLSENTDIRLETEDSSLKVFLDGENVTDKIRDLSVSEKVKYIARVEGVRKNMVKLQRAMGETAEGACMEGRDIGTVVFPDAKYKFFLVASFDERVRRRFKEFEDKGIKVEKESVAKDLKERDHTDMARSVGPLKQADDAVLIDTTNMTIEEVIADILRRIK
jgi:CMP/dCMP kinase